MKTVLLSILGIVCFQFTFSQNYVPFPTGNAEWNNLTWAHWGPSPDQALMINSQYFMAGDTLINSVNYHKIYSFSPDMGQMEWFYCGGLREDENKNIYFFPAETYIPAYAPITFPTNTAEVLLYTFKDLQAGMTLPINQGVSEIKVMASDSVLVGNTYRKRYQIQDRAIAYDYWIEGIGSVKDLFMPFTFEFEWGLFTLCFTDTETYHISWPYGGEDSCHYTLPTGIPEGISRKAVVYPNPATDRVSIDIPAESIPATLRLLDMNGRLICSEACTFSPWPMDISTLLRGSYILEIKSGEHSNYLRLNK